MSDSKLSGFPVGLLARDRIAEAAVEWAGTIPADPEFWGDTGLEFRGEPRIEFRAQSDRRGEVRVTGRLVARVVLSCRRCLEETERDVEVPLDLRFVPGLPAWEEEEGLYGTDPGVPDLVLAPALREELLLALPAFPLCQADCRGLCPRCGTNLNEGECDCVVVEEDERWAALRELKDI
jgi:uncharacterized protein